MVLQMLILIGKRLGVHELHLDREIQQMSQETPLEVLATEIEKQLPVDD
jgi:hypothetical protein